MYSELDGSLTRLFAAVFEQFGDSSGVPWRESVPFDTASRVCLGVWGAYFQIVEQSDVVLEYVFACLRHSDTVPGLAMATAAVEQIGAIAARRVPLSDGALNATLAALRDVTDVLPPRTRIRGVVGMTLALIMRAYTDQCEVEYVLAEMGRCCPLKMPAVDRMAIVEALLFVVGQHWPRVIEAGEEVTNSIIANVREMLARGPEECQRRIREFCQNGVFQEILRMGFGALPTHLFLNGRELVQV
jgi:hypothetical protein